MSIEQLTQSYHVLIDEFLLLHQEALVAMDFELATDIWLQFKSLLDGHIEAENTLLFPAFDELCVEARWPVSLYLHEHHKILSLQTEVELRLQTLQGAPTRRGVVELLDYQRSFKNVIEHHEEREEIALLKEIDAQVEPQILKALHEQLQAVWPAIDSLLNQKEGFEKRLSD